MTFRIYRNYFTNHFNRLSFYQSFFGRFYPHLQNLAYPDPAFLDGGAWVATGLTSERGGVSDLACARWRRLEMAAEVPRPGSKGPAFILSYGLTVQGARKGSKTSAVRANRASFDLNTTRCRLVRQSAHRRPVGFDGDE